MPAKPEAGTEARVFYGEGKASLLKTPEPSRRFISVDSTSALLDHLREGVETHLFCTNNGIQSELIAIPFWQGPKLSYHRAEGVLAITDKDIEVSRRIQTNTNRLVTLSKQLVIAEKELELWQRDDVPGQKHRLIPLELKKQSLKLRLAKAEAALALDEARIDQWNKVPHSVAAEIKSEMDWRIGKGEPVTREWFETRVAQLQGELTPWVGKVGKKETTARSTKARRAQTPVTRGSSGLPEVSGSALLEPPAARARIPTRAPRAALGVTTATIIAELVATACALAPVPTPLTPLPSGATEVDLTPVVNPEVTATIEPSPVTTSTPGLTPTPPETPGACALSTEQMTQKLFDQGIGEKEGSAPLITEAGLAEVFGTDQVEAVAGGITAGIDLMAAKLIQMGKKNIEIPKFAEELAQKHGGNGITIDIKENRDDPRPEGFVSIEAFAFASGGYGIFVRDEEGDWKAVLPSQDSPLSDWIFFPDPQGDVHITDLPAWNYWGELRWVKLDGCPWTAVQVDANGRVLAVLDPKGNTDDINSIWRLNTEVAQVPEEVAQYAELFGVSAEGLTLTEDPYWEGKEVIKNEQGEIVAVRDRGKWLQVKEVARRQPEDEYWPIMIGGRPSPAGFEQEGKLRDRGKAYMSFLRAYIERVYYLVDTTGHANYFMDVSVPIDGKDTQGEKSLLRVWIGMDNRNDFNYSNRACGMTTGEYAPLARVTEVLDELSPGRMVSLDLPIMFTSSESRRGSSNYMPTDSLHTASYWLKMYEYKVQTMHYQLTHGEKFEDWSMFVPTTYVGICEKD